jgi:hypothetical protein
LTGPAGHSSPLSEPTPVPWPWALGRGPVKVCRSQGPAERAAPRELRGHPSLGLCLGCWCLGTGPGLCSVRWGQSMSHPSRVPSLRPLACIVAFLAPLRRALAWRACTRACRHQGLHLWGCMYASVCFRGPLPVRELDPRPTPLPLYNSVYVTGAGLPKRLVSVARQIEPDSDSK